MKKLLFEILASVLLTLLASSVTQVKVGKLQRILKAWGVVRESLEASLLDEEVTLGEVQGLQKGVSKAIEETRRILKS